MAHGIIQEDYRWPLLQTDAGNPASTLSTSSSSVRSCFTCPTFLLWTLGSGTPSLLQSLWEDSKNFSSPWAGGGGPWLPCVLPVGVCLFFLRCHSLSIAAAVLLVAWPLPRSSHFNWVLCFTNHFFCFSWHPCWYRWENKTQLLKWMNYWYLLPS